MKYFKLSIRRINPAGVTTRRRDLRGEKQMADTRIHRVKVRLGGFVSVPVDPEMIESEEWDGSVLDLAADLAQVELTREGTRFPDLTVRVDRDTLEECK
jgi:hypothetical protein